MINPSKSNASDDFETGDLAQTGADDCGLAHSSRTHAVPTKRRKAAPVSMTTKFLDGLKCSDGRMDIFDAITKGLSLRVTADRKSWSFLYTPPGGTARARLGLGTYPATDLATARTKAVEARGLVESGKDPRTVTNAQPVVKTMAQLIEDRLDQEVRGKLRTADEVERRYKKDVIPVVGTVPVRDFRISHLNMILNPVRKRGSLRAVGVLFQDLRALFNFAISQEEVEYSPIAKAKVSLGWTPRDRFLSLEEIKTVWRMLPGALAKSDSVPVILKICLVTGQRLSEVAGMRRPEIDMQKREWLIPAARAKNGHDHLVPLSDLATMLIGDALRETNGDYLFPNNEGGGPLQHYAIDRTLGRAQEERPDMPLGKFGIARWMPHDLRRTMATQMSMEENGLEIPDLYISHVLNHRSATKSSITQRIYIQNTYAREKREALDKWGEFLANLVGVETGLRAVA